MNVAIIGGSGFIGTNLCLSLQSSVHTITVIDRVPARIEGINYKNIDIANAQDVQNSLEHIDYVFMLAADSDATAISKSDIRKNVQYLENVIEACRYNNIQKLLYSSTIWVDGDQADPYTQMKRQCEELLRTSDMSKRNNPYQKVRYVIMRYGIPYGPYARDNLVVPTFFKRALSNKDITINGRGNGRRFIYIDDLATVNTHLLSNRYIDCTAYIDGSEFVSLDHLAQSIIKLTKSKSNVMYDKNRSIDFKCNGTSNEFNDTVTTSIDEGLEKYYNWMINE